MRPFLFLPARPLWIARISGAMVMLAGVSVLIGWLLLEGQKAGWYGTEVGLTIFATANVLTFTALTWHTAGKLHDEDIRRRMSEDARARYVSIVESSDDAIIGKTLDGVITSWNPAAEKVFGYAEAEVLGRPMLTLFPPDLLDEEASILERLRRGERIRHYETVRVRKDGRRIDISGTTSPFKNERGEVIGASTICHDISERKRAERTLLRERNFSRAAIDSMPGIFYLYDRKGKFLRWNRNFERVSGYSADEIAVMHPLDFFAGGDKRLVAARIEEVLEAGQSDVEADFVSKDGRTTSYYFTGLRTTLDDETCLVGVGLDITDRRRAEAEAGLLTQRLKHATDAAGIGVWDWDIKSDNWYATEMYFTMLGYGPDEGVCLRDVWIERLHPEDRAMVVTKIKAIVAGENIPYFYQARMRHADGTYRWVQVVGRVLATNDAGRPTRMIGARIDITEIKRAEAKIHELNTELERRVTERTAQLEAANRELEAFSYSVSHDLRAPLRTVDGYSQAVLEDFGPQLPDEGRRYLATIRRGAQQMGALIDDLLKFARLSRATMQVESVDMGRMVRTALVDLHFDAGDARVELRLEDLPACQGDPALLRQVWMNLLSNALKYSGRREKAVIEIGSRREGEDCVYFVRDNGAGFDMRYAGKLFGVFQRLHRAEDYEGTGVGLAIVQRIVHRHGGRIWAEARENQGAAFYFTVEQKTLS